MSALARRSKADAMTGPEVLDIGRDTIITLVLAAGPLMLVGLLVGVVISLFQALTQIQEMTLVFVPKIIALFITLLIVLPFIGELLEAYMMRLAARIMGG
jgi:flagellar biosynthesis protein FliQ